MIFKGSGKFEVKTRDEIMIASGIIRLAETRNKYINEIILLKEEMKLFDEQNIYSNLLLHGYQYEESYNIINGLSTSYSNRTLKWSSDWRLLLDGLIQVHIISNESKSILIPSRIKKLVIDKAQLTENMKENNALSMKFDKRVNEIACPGIEMSGIQFKEIIFINRNGKIVADELRFIQNINETNMNISDILNVVLGLIFKNSTEKILVINDSKNKNENILELLNNIIQRTRKNLNIKLITRELLYQTLNENFVLTIINNAHYNDVRKFISTLGKESYLLTIVETEEEYNAISILKSVGLNVVLRIKVANCRTALLLHKEKNVGKTVVVYSQENCLDRLRICLRDLKYDNVIFVVNTIIDNDIFKILQNIKQEPGYKKLQIFDLQDEKAPKFSLQNEFYEPQINLNLRENVLAPNGVWGTYRWMPFQAKSTSPSRWQAKIDKSGSLVWVEELPLNKEKNNRIVKVKCSAFDLGVYEYWLKNDVSLESQISITEYSGIDEKGRRVMGLVDNLTISNEILPDSDFTWIIPETLSFEEAATIPHAYLAAFCILHLDTWRFKRIKTVLVHYGASDVGQALINLSISYNFDVYTTYETDAEKRVIESMRPCLPQSNIINVKNYKIDSIIITEGKGFDFVVASYSIIDHMEICLDIVKNLKHLVIIYDCRGPNYNPCPLSNFIRFISVYSCCLQDLIKLPQKKKSELAELMRKALQAGTIKPIISQRNMIHGAAEERKIAACERYGKVLVHLQEEKKISHFIPQLFFHSDKCYLVIDGFNIFGKVLIEWMIEQGARKLIIVSNMSIQGHENSVLKWQENGATVVVRHEVDLSKAASFDKLLKEALTLGQLDGIFDLQRTKMHSSSSSTNYFKVSQLLDKHSKKLFLSHVKFFIFSSLNLDKDGLRDPNLEKLCTKRKESGHHGLFILLPNFIENTLTKTELKNVYYTKMALFLKRLNAILCTDSSVIVVRYIIGDNSVNDNEKNIVAEETDKKQRIDEGIRQKEEIRQFEKYLYNYD
ncbi:hypothetical protein M0804_014433 [Polistes exclamans]|nr:hypothetical protein M0804_014433 [Polistes exclamans]